MQQNNKERLAQFFDLVWNQGLESAVDEFLAPGYTIHHDPGDPWQGKCLDLSGFKQRLRLSRAPFPDQRFQIQEMIEQDGRIAVSWLWRGSFQADLPGFPATGKTLHMSGLTVYYFQGNRICGHWQQTDRLGIFQQLSQ